jgi:hypothetical protein
MAFNFKVFDSVAMAEEGSTLHLIVPATGLLANDGDTPVTITFKGPKSKDGKAALQKRAARTRMVLKKYDKTPDAILSDDESAQLRKITAEAYAEMAINWTGFSDDKDKPLPLTKENFVKFCLEFMEIQSQIEKFILGEESFLKA